MKFILNIEDNIEIYCHGPSFEMIIQNLIDNACKYTSNNGIINIILNKNKFVISDNGVGIKRENLNKIRNRFWQEDASKSDKKSFGLGLYLVKKLIDLQKWNIDIKSVYKKGTTITISFNK